MLAKEIMQSIQFLRGKFSPSEASETLMTLIKDRINFHQIQKLGMWEFNHDSDTSYHERRIEELFREKELSKELIREAEREGYEVEIYGTIQVRLTKRSGHPVDLEISNN